MLLALCSVVPASCVLATGSPIAAAEELLPVAHTTVHSTAMQLVQGLLHVCLRLARCACCLLSSQPACALLHLNAGGLRAPACLPPAPPSRPSPWTARPTCPVRVRAALGRGTACMLRAEPSGGSGSNGGLGRHAASRSHAHQALALPSASLPHCLPTVCRSQQRVHLPRRGPRCAVFPLCPCCAAVGRVCWHVARCGLVPLGCAPSAPPTLPPSCRCVPFWVLSFPAVANAKPLAWS